MAGKKFYVVYVGRRPGIYATWPRCQDQVLGYPGNSYESFPTLDDAREALSSYLDGDITTAPQATAIHGNNLQTSSNVVTPVQGTPSGLLGTENATLSPIRSRAVHHSPAESSSLNVRRFDAGSSSNSEAGDSGGDVNIGGIREGTATTHLHVGELADAFAVGCLVGALSVLAPNDIRPEK